MPSQPAVDHAPSRPGLTLKDAVLIALKDGEGHPRADVLACLEGPAGPAPMRAARAERQTLFSRTVQELQTDGRITVAGGGPDGTGPDAVLRLVPPEPDDRFEIDPAFRDLLPPPSPGEVADLERQILTEGCRDPLVTWTDAGRPFLIDGYTRLTICRRHRRPYALTTQELPDRKAVVDWMWAHHYGRRNFTPEAQSYARGRFFHAQRLGHGGDRRSGESKGQRVTLKGSAEAVAARFKVTRRTVFRDAAFAAALDRIAAVCGPAVRTKVLCRALLLTRGRAVLLAQKDEAQMRRLVADLLAGKKVTLSTVVQTTVRLALPRGKPAEQAEVLIERLGPKAAGRLSDALAGQLHRRRRPPQAQDD
ncbi:MAG: hypothetical protein HYS12_29695 [Planctomycetes bacterium]|nr:hypothetical protein [Planctomycetota bacterium]